MSSFNRVILVGNLTRDPELRYIPSGTAVCDVGLAVNDKRKDASGQWVEETTFVDITLWDKTAEVAAEWLKKGSSCLIEGRLKLDTWESKEGEKRSKLKVIGERMQMLGGKGEGGGESNGRGGRQASQGGGRAPTRGGAGRLADAQHNAVESAVHAPADDDIPF